MKGPLKLLGGRFNKPLKLVNVSLVPSGLYDLRIHTKLVYD